MLSQVSALQQQQSGDQLLGQNTVALQQQQLLQQSKQQQQVTQQVGFPFPCGSYIHTNLAWTIMKFPTIGGFFFSFSRCIINLIWPEKPIWPFWVTIRWTCASWIPSKKLVFSRIGQNIRILYLSYLKLLGNVSVNMVLLVWGSAAWAWGSLPKVF